MSLNLEDAALFEASNELFNGSYFHTGFTDRGFLYLKRRESSRNINFEVFRFHLFNGLLTSLGGSKSQNKVRNQKFALVGLGMCEMDRTFMMFWMAKKRGVFKRRSQVTMEGSSMESDSSPPSTSRVNLIVFELESTSS